MTRDDFIKYVCDQYREVFKNNYDDDKALKSANKLADAYKGRYDEGKEAVQAILQRTKEKHHDEQSEGTPRCITEEECRERARMEEHDSKCILKVKMGDEVVCFNEDGTISVDDKPIDLTFKPEEPVKDVVEKVKKHLKFNGQVKAFDNAQYFGNPISTELPQGLGDKLMDFAQNTRGGITYTDIMKFGKNYTPELGRKLHRLLNEHYETEDPEVAKQIVAIIKGTEKTFDVNDTKWIMKFGPMNIDVRPDGHVFMNEVLQSWTIDPRKPFMDIMKEIGDHLKAVPSLKENLEYVKEQLHDAPVEVKGAYNSVIDYFADDKWYALGFKSDVLSWEQLKLRHMIKGAVLSDKVLKDKGWKNIKVGDEIPGRGPNPTKVVIGIYSNHEEASKAAERWMRSHKNDFKSSGKSSIR